MSVGRLLRLVAAIAILAVLQSLFSAGMISPYAVRIIALSCFSVMLAVSLNIINGFAGQFSIGHAGFYAIGAYVGGAVSVYAGPSILTAGLGAAPDYVSGTVLLLLAIVVASAASGFAGLIVGLPTLRLRGDYLAIATLGFGEMIRVVILNVDAVGGALGFNDIPVYSSFFWIGLFTVGCVWIARNLLNSRHGRALQALRDDEIAAETLGIDTTRHKVMAFVLSSALAGCAGALYAHYDGYLQPESFNFIRSIEIIIMVVIGGMGSVTGAVIAAIALTVLPELLRDLADYRMVIYSALLIITMLVRPQGLLGKTEFSFRSMGIGRKENPGGLA